MGSTDRGDLVAEEGVDEGSADSTRESRRTPGDVTGAPPRGAPAGEADPAGPVPTSAPDVDRAEAQQPGQELEEGEG
jgi:hypothetical protein